MMINMIMYTANSINQSFICETNTNRQDSDARQYTSFTGFQGRKASTDTNPLNTCNTFE